MTSFLIEVWLADTGMTSFLIEVWLVDTGTTTHSPSARHCCCLLWLGTNCLQPNHVVSSEIMIVADLFLFCSSAFQFHWEDMKACKTSVGTCHTKKKLVLEHAMPLELVYWITDSSGGKLSAGM